MLVSGVQLGNVWVGVQPALGVEGDPMRLLFERDLTPHPQYAAFYQWLQHDFCADAVLHFGMHGTVEWLPGAPLGTLLAFLPSSLLCVKSFAEWSCMFSVDKQGEPSLRPPTDHTLLH